MGTSALAVAAGLAFFILREVRIWRREGRDAVGTRWRGDASYGAVLTAGLWLCLFAWCVSKTVFDDHKSLISQKLTLTAERDDLKAENEGLLAERGNLKTENENLKQAPPHVVTRTLPAQEGEGRCWLSNHFGMANSTVKGAVTATAAIIHCNAKIDAPFAVTVEFDRDFIPGALVLPDSGAVNRVGEGKQGKIYVGKINSPALLSNELIIVTVYGDTDQYPRALRANVQALK